jgi:hypothetical protein
MFAGNIGIAVLPVIRFVFAFPQVQQDVIANGRRLWPTHPAGLK